MINKGPLAMFTTILSEIKTPELLDNELKMKKMNIKILP